jgi:LmbE family N-acetylglucosaminyl deacetylase
MADERRNILVVFPHPDDEVACAGTIAKLTRAGHRAYYLCLTKGNRGTYERNVDPEQLAATRAVELHRSAEAVGVRDVTILTYDDGYLQPSDELRGAIIRAVRLWKIDTLYTLDPWRPYEPHPDHRHGGMMACESVVFAHYPLYYPEHLVAGLEPYEVQDVYLWSSHEPDTYVDISATIEQKLAALSAYASQMPQLSQLGASTIRERTATWGQRIGVAHAEAFKALRVRAGHFR